MLGDRLLNIFRRGVTDQPLPVDDTAYSFNNLVSTSLFTQYNPDELLSRKGYEVYKKMMTDEQVKAVVRFHRDAVTGREWSFEDHPDLTPEENEERRKLLNAILKKMPGSFKTKMDMVMSSLYTGFSLVEKTLDLVDIEGKTWVGIKSLKLKPFDTFYFILDDFGNLDRLEQRAGGRHITLDLAKFIHHVCNSDVHEYYGQSELREAYRAWWSKDTALLLQNVYLERTAAGFVWARPEKGKSLTVNSPEYNKLINVLSTIRSNSSMLLPSGIELNVEQPIATDVFERALQGFDKAIAKSLLMPNLLGLSEQGPNGSRALGDTQLEAFLWMLDAEAAQLEEVLNEQLFEELAHQNFPDGMFPPFRLHELSNKKKMEVLDKWVALTTGKPLDSTDADAEHIRATLGFPLSQEDEDDEAIDLDPTKAAAGTAALDIIERVAKETIPRDTGIKLLTGVLSISEDDAEAIMGDVGKGFEPKQPVIPPQLQPGDPEGGDDVDTNQNPDDSPSSSPPDDQDMSGGETVIGRGGSETIEVKMAKARNRVAFQVIEKKSLDIEQKYISELSAKNLDLMEPIEEQLSGELTADTAKQLKFRGRDVQKVRNQVKRMLTESWALGLKHAKDEISKARGETMSASFQRLDEDAAEFFNSKAFTVTGKLTSDMLAIIQNNVSNGIKASLSTREIIDSIYEQFAAQGYLTPQDAEGAMQGILQSTEAATARLSTIVRTNTFEAINEARYSYFTDPELNDFVEAMEYSAILDSRTTQICRHLDGQVHAASGEVWNGPWRPPNHFNCRSLLIPVTEFDAWSEDDLPDMRPQEGFG